MLANCGTDTDKARQALTRYIARKQEKGRPTEHILKKLRQLELKVGSLDTLPSPPSVNTTSCTQFINDTTLHTAFRDARASTCLPRSPDVPLPDFVLRETAARTRRDSRQSLSAQRDFATPSPSPSTPKSWLQPSYSPVQHAGTSIIEEDRIQPEEALHNTSETSSRRPSLPPINALGRLPVLSPYAFQISSGRSRSSTLPSSPMSSTFTHSPKKLRTSYNSPPPTSPLPDIPLDATDDYDSHSPRFHLPPSAKSRPFSSSSKSSSSSHSSYLNPRTPEIVQPLHPGFSSQSATRGDISYPPRTEKDLPQQPLVVTEHYPSETDIPSMFLPSREGSFEACENSGGDCPVPYRDSPILRERPVSHNHNFSFPLDNALQLCNASLVVRREVTRCLQQDQDYEQYNWPTVLQECGIAEDDIPFLLNEMAREVEFTVSRA